MTIINELIYWLIAYTIYKIITKIRKTDKSTYRKLYSVSKKTDTNRVCSFNNNSNIVCSFNKQNNSDDIHNYSSIESIESNSSAS